MRFNRSTRNRSMSLRLALPFALFGLAACQDSTPTASSSRPEPAAPSLSAAAQDDRLILPGEQDFARLAREQPGFAGYHYDWETGDLVASVKNLDRAEEARAAVEPVITQLRRVSERARRGRGGVRVRQVQFGFDELRVWRDHLTPVLFSKPQVLSIDLDEKENRVWVGVRQASARAEVMAEAKRLGIPASAVTVQMVEPICPAQGDTCDPCTVDPASCEPDPCETDPSSLECQPPTTEPVEPDTTTESYCPPDVSCNITPGQTTVGDRYRPVLGGLLITRPKSYNPYSGWSYYTCTLGWNTIYNGQYAFVTNSHCTADMGTVNNNSAFYQWRYRDSDRLGYEAFDPPFNLTYDPYTFSYCSYGAKCRYSDAAVVTYNSGVNIQLRAIVRTELWNGSRVIDQTNPYFPILAERTGRPVQDAALDKVGYRTGWTYGRTIRTCVHHRSGTSDKFLFCQGEVQSYGTNRIVQGGDSGSPVFYWHGSYVDLQGILWGEVSNTGGKVFIFSPLENVFRDLGNVTSQVY